ncbi:MAG: flagellar hook-associated protein FlgL [bacterium]
MYIRPTTLGTTNLALNDILSSQAKYNTLSEQSSSGLKVSKPSDDPTAAKSILDVNASISQLNGYLDNINVTQTELDTQESTLSSLSSLIEKASGLATQAANQTYSQTELTAMKSQVDLVLNSVLDLANTKYNGNYIFSGTNTSTPAYTVDVAGNITYKGTASTDSYQRYVQISDGVFVPINAPGDQVFGSYDAATNTGTGLIGTLKALSNAMGAGNNAGISGSLDNLSNDLNTALLVRTKTAAISSKFELTTSSINTAVTNLTSYKSNLEDIDLSAVLAKLASAQVAMQATMSTASKTLSGLSLLNYL